MDWQRTPSINHAEWSLDPIWKRILENREHPDPRRRALIIKGRDLREYSQALATGVRNQGGFVINGQDDAASVITRQLDSYSRQRLRGVFGASSSKSVSVFERNKDRLGFGVDDQTRAKIYKGDPLLGSVSTIRAIADAAALSVGGKIVLYHPNHGAPTNFERLIVPAIESAEGAFWIFVGDGIELENYGVEVIERTYLTRHDLTQFMAERLGVNASDVAAMVSTTRPITSFDVDRMTVRQFNEAIRYYWRVAESYAFPQGPEVPPPARAPIQFLATVAGVAVDRREDDDALGSDSVSEVAAEILQSVGDIRNHHGISNAAPALSAKLQRIEDQLSSIDEDASDTSVIRLGVATLAAYEQVKWEGENIGASAVGAVHAVLSSLSLMLNRIPAWKEYVLEASDFSVNNENNTTDKADVVAILTELLTTDGLLLNRSATHISAYRAEIQHGGYTNAEQSGFIRVAQNLVSVLARFLRSQIKRAAQAASDGPFEIIKAGSTMLVLSYLWSVRHIWQSLADKYPFIFGWVPPFLHWTQQLLK